MDTDSNSEIDNSEKSDSSDCDESDVIEIKPPKDYNVVHKIFNRQVNIRKNIDKTEVILKTIT